MNMTRNRNSVIARSSISRAVPTNQRVDMSVRPARGATGRLVLRTRGTVEAAGLTVVAEAIGAGSSQMPGDGDIRVDVSKFFIAV